MSEDLLKFSPYSSFINSSFWQVLAQKKLDKYKLDEGPFTLFGYCNHLYNAGSGNKLMIEMESFEPSLMHANNFTIEGKLWIFNTIENFRNQNKNEFLNMFGKQFILPFIIDGSYLNNPALLCKFGIINYCDLKKFKFYYWFSYPAAVFPVNPKIKCPPKNVEDFFSKETANYLYSLIEKSILNNMFFSVYSKNGTFQVDDFSRFDVNDQSYILGFCDPSNNPNYPGWSLRNVLFAICCTQIPKNEKRTVKVLSYRRSVIDTQSLTQSSIISVELMGINLETTDVKFTGWEKWLNEYQPRMSDLSRNMDPIKLTDRAVDLNLKLMKWRLMPNLDLDAIKNAKCLLLGSGTLGCNVARQLLAWNVKTITLVDNGRVSYSNPVRQTLFTYEQSLNGGLNKAKAAMQSLKAIYPGVNADFCDITIPMPGHPVSTNELEDVKKACQKLSALVESHDVIFLLLDTREARWLPSVLGYMHTKLVINAALGFDTYLVMRHGIAPDRGVSPSLNQTKPNFNNKPTDQIPGDELGCYFCTDVVGPSDSTKDRSLDQQCTVTRPGVSMTAAALAVELMSTILQHKDKAKAEANARKDSFEFDSCLGATPHQIRGYMACFSNINPFHRASVHCTACSQQVLDAYATGGFDFLLKVFNDHNYLESVAGLSDLKNSIDFDCVIALSDDEDDSS